MLYETQTSERTTWFFSLALVHRAYVCVCPGLLEYTAMPHPLLHAQDEVQLGPVLTKGALLHPSVQVVSQLRVRNMAVRKGITRARDKCGCEVV